MNIAEWLAASARARPEAPALFTGREEVARYREFARRAASIAASLVADHGVRPGHRVGLFSKNRTEYLEALYGILWCGAAMVPINSKLHLREAAWILEDSGASLVFVAGDGDGLAEAGCATRAVDFDSPQFEAMRRATGDASPVERAPDDLAWLFYTSGTTGRPKGVMLSHRNLISCSLCYPTDVDSVEPEDTSIYAAPMSHGAGLYNFIHVRKAARHCVPQSGGFEAEELLDLAGWAGSASLFAAPTMVKRLVDTCERLGKTGEGIKTVVYGGGPMYLADIQKALHLLGPRFVQIYGQGESPMTITALPRADHLARSQPRYLERLASVGFAQSAVEVRVTGEDGNAVDPGVPGEIEVRGDPVMLGYWNNPVATAETLRNGWLRTGDVGSLDADGYLTLTDRSKDVIISGGTNIYPREVEEVLLRHDAVQEVSVIGTPDPEWGEQVAAFVVLRPGAKATAEMLDAFCIDAMARFKRPKRYIFVDDLPKNNYGKVLKTELRKRAG